MKWFIMIPVMFASLLISCLYIAALPTPDESEDGFKVYLILMGAGAIWIYFSVTPVGW